MFKITNWFLGGASQFHHAYPNPAFRLHCEELTERIVPSDAPLEPVTLCHCAQAIDSNIDYIDEPCTQTDAEPAADECDPNGGTAPPPDGTPFDLDGDGNPDGTGYDFDGDGNPDEFDIDGDGNPDGIGIDLDDDGVFDGVLVD